MVLLVAVLSGALLVPAWAAPGDLDRTFSGDGKLAEDFGADDGGNAVLVQPDGKIVAIGARRGGPGGSGGVLVARYDARGALDPSFSDDGKLSFDEMSGDAALLQRDGKIVIGGASLAPSGFTLGDFALARLNPDGSFDSGFDGDGRVVTDFSETSGGVTSDPNVSVDALALQPDDRIVAGGGTGDRRLARYNPDGSLDSGFSGDGKQRTEFGSFAGTNAVVVQPGGKLLTLGEGGLARYNGDGSLDTTFSGDGKQQVGRGATDDLAVQDDGRIVAVGGATVARLNADGSTDGTFSGDGLAPVSGHPAAVAITADRRVLVAGNTADSENLACWLLASRQGARPTPVLPVTASSPPASPARSAETSLSNRMGRPWSSATPGPERATSRWRATRVARAGER